MNTFLYFESRVRARYFKAIHNLWVGYNPIDNYARARERGYLWVTFGFLI